MTNPLEAARLHLLKTAEHLELAKTNYENAKATHQSAKTLFESIEKSQLGLASVGNVGELCDSCSNLPISAIFDHASNSKNHRRKVGDLFHSIENYNTCQLCCFLIQAFQLGHPEYAERLHAGLTPRDTAIYFTSDANGKPWFKKAGIDVDLDPCPFVWLQTGPPTQTGQPHICIALEPRSLDDSKPRKLPGKAYPRLRDPLEAFNGSVNYDVVQSWIKKCDQSHGDQCGQMKPQPPLHMHLINVHDRSIVVAPPHSRYVALSYVWGKTAEAQLSAFFSRSDERQDKDTKSPILNQLPAEIPQTMEDALIFVKRLGEKYLWIDLFCINQKDLDQKQHQISLMDQIFASAYLTLVALDGNSADWGLPGISRPLVQCYQRTVTLGAGRLTASYIFSVEDQNGTSIWDSRAWTLQERLLSPRCVIFAETYVAMQCQNEAYHDLVVSDVHENTITSRLGDDYFWEDGSSIDLNQEEWDFKTFDALVSVYTARKLTYPSDALNACRGALNRISLKTSSEFYYGIPTHDIHRSLLWKPHHEHVLQRRSEFPSWSWLGWLGRIEYAYWVGDMSDYSSDGHEEQLSKRRRIAFYKPDKPHPESATVSTLESELHSKSAIGVTSTLARFHVRCIRTNGSNHRNLTTKTQQSRVAVGDHWTMVGKKGEALRNFAGEHPIFESTDVFFRLDPQDSETLRKQQNEADFLFIHHWPRLRDSKMSGKWLYDLVSALLIVRNEDGTAWRLSSVLMKAEDWHTQIPVPGQVFLV